MTAGSVAGRRAPAAADATSGAHQLGAETAEGDECERQFPAYRGPARETGHGRTGTWDHGVWRASDR
jgi:hypothetical protein